MNEHRPSGMPAEPRRASPLVALAASMLILALILVACGGGDGEPLIQPTPTPAPTASLTDAFPSLPNFTEPVALLQAPSDGARWFVVERGGRVLVFQNVANVSAATSFVDISARVDASGDEMGLLGMAFHPNFPTDPRVFLSYTARPGGQGSQIVSRISAFTTSDAGLTLDPSSESVLLTVNQPESNHNGGHLAFHPQGGYLYIGFGDGGGAGDQHTANGPNGNAQSLTTLLGKILRIDVNGAAPYSAPLDNPYAGNALCGNGGSGAANCPEIHAYGFRNPWRWSFDRSTGELWVGDVGQAGWEEIDQVQRGGNYGWRYREGAHCYNPSVNCPSSGLIDPVAEYARVPGGAVTGGYVYRGTQTTTLEGRYLFGDFGSGQIWAWLPDQAAQARAPTQLLDSTLHIASFGEGDDGELYVVDYGGRLYRLALSS